MIKQNYLFKTYLLLILIQQYQNTSGHSTGCNMLQKIGQVGRQDFFFFTFLLLFLFYCIQRACEVLKQNLVKFKHSSNELKSQTISIKLNGTEIANLWLFGKKVLFFYNFLWILAKEVTFLKEFPLSSMRNSKSCSVDVFNFLNMLEKSSFYHGIYSTVILTHIFFIFFIFFQTLLKDHNMQ